VVEEGLLIYKKARLGLDSHAADVAKAITVIA